MSRLSLQGSIATLLLATSLAPVWAATITIVNLDGAGEGFNDPTVVAVEGGNTATTRGGQRLQLFQAAANVWASKLASIVVIKVGAKFDPFPVDQCTTGGGVLGFAGPTDLYTAPSGLPRPNTIYVVAEVEAITAANQNLTDNELDASFNTNVDGGCLGAGSRFWYGTNPAIPVPANRVALFPVVLHEIAHGLGFLSFVCVDPAGCGAGNPQGSELADLDDAWSVLTRDRVLNLHWGEMTDAQRADSLNNDPSVIWDGAAVTAALPTLQPGSTGTNGSGVNRRLRLHTPATVVPGSSVSHWTSAATSPDLLMEPSLSVGVFDNVDMTVPLFADIGWPLIGAVNQAPVITRPLTLAVTEDVATAITGVSVTDPDAGSGNFTLTFSAPSGAFNSPGCAGATSGGSSAARTLSGTLANLNSCLSGSSLQYTTALNSTASVTMTIVANDNGNTGSGGAMSDTETTMLNVTAVNDAPVNTVPASIAVNEDVATGLTGISFADVDIASGNLQVTLGIPSGSINFPVCTGVVTSGTATARVLTGTLTQVNTCFASASRPTFTPAANATASVNLTVTSSDNGNTGTGGALGDTDVVSLDVTAVNDAPVNTVPASIAVNEDVATGLAGISFADVDIASGNLQVTLGVPGGSISSPTCAGVVATGSATSRVLTGTLAQVNACFAGANRPTYTTAPDATADVNLTVTSSDNGNTGTGGALGDTDVVPLNVTAINDAPVNTVPASIAVNEDVATGLTGISFADVDIAAGNLQVTLGVPGGSISSPTCAGVVATGSATSRVLTGTLAQVNACFAGASRPTYTTALNATADVNLTVTSSDNGNTGTGGALGDTDVVSLNVSAVNDAPVNTVPASIAVNEDVATGLTGISFADVDIAAGNLQVTLGVPGGSISSPACAGVVATGSATSRVLTGTLAQVNACFAGASRPTFTTAPDATADVNLTVTSSDNGNTGTGGALGDTDVVSLDVAAANDAPSVTLPSSIAITVPGTSPLRNIEVADVDSAGAAVTATLTVPVGTLNATSGGGVTVVGSGTPMVVLTGTIANLAAFFDADLVSYTAGGDTTLTVTLNDLGNTGSGGPQSDVATTPLLGDAIFSNSFE